MFVLAAGVLIVLAVVLAVAVRLAALGAKPRAG